MARWSWPATILALVGIAFALRLIRIETLSLWRDEVDTLVFAGRDLPSLLQTFGAPGENAPLYFLLMKPWLALAGTTEFALRLPSALFGAAAVAPAMMIARRLMGLRAAVLAGALLAVQPFLVWYGQEGRVYALLVFAVMLHALLLLRLTTAGRPLGGTVAAGVLGAVMLPLHMLVPVFLLANLGLALVASSGRNWRNVLATLVPAAVVALPGVVWQLRVLLDGVPSLYPVVDPVSAIGRMGTATVVGPGWGGPWDGVTVFLVLVALLFHRNRAGLALAVWTLVPLALLLAVNERFPIFLERYLIPALVPALIAIAALLARLGRPGLVVAGLVATVWTVASLNPVALKPDLRTLGATMQSVESSPVVLVVAPWWQESVRYYTPRAIQPPIPDDLAIDPGAADRLLPALLLGAKTVWLVQLEYSDWDSRGFIRGWLQREAELIDRLQLTWVSAERYRLPNR